MLNYFGGLNDMSHSTLAFPASFVFIVAALREGLVLSIVFPSGHRVQVSITDPSVDSESSKLVVHRPDQVFVSLPQLRRTIGPISLLKYIA
jgi:hypothetical protein